MKRIFFLCAAMMLVINGAIFAADPAEGYWVSVDDKTGNRTAGWQIYIHSDGKLRGRIVSSPGVYANTRSASIKDSYSGFPEPGKVSEKPILGTPWLWGLESKNPGEWRGGKIIDPNDGNMYTGTVTFHAAGSKQGSRTFSVDTLEMRGSIGPFGRSQYWVKATQAEASNVR